MPIFPNDSNEMDGAGLEHAIEVLGVSISELARRIGYSRRTIQRWRENEVPVPEAVALLLNAAVEINQWCDRRLYTQIKN